MSRAIDIRWIETRETEARKTICPLTRAEKSAKGKRCIASECTLWRYTGRLIVWPVEPPRRGDWPVNGGVGYCGLGKIR